MTLAYDRAAEQGTEVEFPPGVPKLKRTAFGHNGKGRFSPFCFGDAYTVKTRRDGTCVRASVKVAPGPSGPFLFRIEEESHGQGHGTTISVKASRGLLADSYIREWIGYKFAVDPSFEVLVNGVAVKLLDLKEHVATKTVDVSNHGRVYIHRIDPQRQERTMQLLHIGCPLGIRQICRLPELVTILATINDKAGHALWQNATRAWGVGLGRVTCV